MSFILFDEIEKANDALWQLLLGILDKGTLTLGDNRRVDMSRCVIFMTSNLGSAEMTGMLQGSGIGFTTGALRERRTSEDLDDKLYRTALEACRRKFSPEFMNRLDKVVVFRALSEANLRQVLDIELNEVQARIGSTQSNRQFVLNCTAEAKDFLLREGTDLKYGARHLKRAIERHLVFPVSNLIATGQIGMGDVVKVDLKVDGEKLVFSKEKPLAPVVNEAANVLDFTTSRRASPANAKASVSEGQVASRREGN